MGGKMTAASVMRLSTTEGRQRLPDLIQSVFGEKRVIIFHRYGRDLAALVPLEMLPQSGDATVDVPKCSQCGGYFPESTSQFCAMAICPHRALDQGD
jgi:hypothetical protein